MSRSRGFGFVPLLIVIVLLGVAGYLILRRSDYTKYAPSPTISPNSTNRPAGENTFSYETVKPGQVIAGMTVKSVGKYDPQYEPGVNLSTSNAKVVFTGQAKITGRYRYTDIYGNQPKGSICIEELDEQSALKLPIALDDGREPWFCFDNSSKALSNFPSRSTMGTSTVIIDNYTINSFPSEVMNTATLVSVVSKK